MTRRLLAALSFVTLLLATSACSVTPAPTAPQLEFALDSSTAGLAVAQHLPGTLTFSERMGTAQVAELPSPILVTAGSVVDRYSAGDVAYSPDEGALIVFTTNGVGAAEADVVRIGSVAAGLSDLSNCVRDCAYALVVDGAPTAP